jgi:hypothetical protein
MREKSRKPKQPQVPDQDLDPSAMLAEAVEAMSLAEIGSILLQRARHLAAMPAVEPSTPYRDRSGDEQGYPLTGTEIREGIEDDSGALADIEIDDDAFCGPDEECR